MSVIGSSCGRNEEPFVPFAVAFAGTSSNHDVVTWTRSAGTGSAVERSDVGAWEGALVFDGLSESSSDELVGRFAREVRSDVAGSIGWRVDGSSTSAYLFDPDHDGLVDLTVYRHAPNDADVPAAYDPMTFLAFDHRETAIARAGLGTDLLIAYESRGLAGVACAVADVQVHATRTNRSSQRGSAHPAVNVSCTPSPDASPVLSSFAGGGAGGAWGARARGVASRVSVPLPRQGFAVPCAADHTAHQLSVDEGAALRHRRDSFEHGPDEIARNRWLISAAKELKKLQGNVDFLDKLDNAGSADAQRLLITKRLVAQLEGKAVKGMIGIFGPSDQGQQQLWANVYSLIKTGLKANPAGAFKAIVDTQLWAAEQALRVAEVLRDTTDKAIAANRAKTDNLRRDHLDCLDRNRTDDDDRIRGRGKGEPHLSTFDGYHYDFQAVGEFVLATGEDFEVQVRYGPIREGNVSVAVAVGFILPGASSSIFVDAVDQPTDGWTVYLDGVPHPVASGTSQVGAYAVVADRTTITFSTPGAVDFELSRMTTDRELFNITEVVVETDSSTIVHGGLLGDIDRDPTNDLRLRDGTVFDPDAGDFRDLYDVFGQSWRISDRNDSLMLYEPGEGPDTYFNPRYPESDVSLSTLTDDQLWRGLEPCLAGGVWIEPALSDCAFDVAVLDDDLWVEGGVQAQRVLERGAADRQLIAPAGPLSEPGSYVLWERDGVRVHGFVTWSVTGHVATAVLRGLLVDTPGDNMMIWPEWRTVPPSIPLDGSATLTLSRTGRHGLVAAIDDTADGATGLLADVEISEQSGPGDRWHSNWLEVSR